MDIKIPVDRPSVVDRRGFMRVMGGGAAVAGLAACADDGNDGRSPSARSVDADTTSVAVAAPQVDARRVSITPTLTRLADLKMADSDEAHMAYAPDVPPPISRTDQRIVEFEIDVLESVCPVDPANGVSVEMWGFRIGGDTQVTCGAPGR